MMIRRFAAAAIAAGCFAAPLAAAGPEADFGWMSGCWEASGGDGGKWAEECWTPPRGGVLLGTGRSGSADAVASFEFMRIAPGADGVPVFWGSPGGSAAVPFRLVRQRASEAVFENLAHDYPVTIRYWREGDVLHAETSGPERKNPMSWRYVRIDRP